MKKIISHRGNLSGPSPSLENKPDYINTAIQKGLDVEVDVWLVNGSWFLGHDKPVYEINYEFINSEKIWCHAKNLEAFNYMLKDNIHCFWHQSDKCILTSRGFLWCYPEVYLENGITVVIGKEQKIPKECKILGICTDYPVEYIKSDGAI